MGPINWAGRTVHVQVTVNTVQEGNRAIADAVVEKRTKARGAGCPHRMTKVTRTPATAYNIEEWIWGVEGTLRWRQEMAMLLIAGLSG